MAFGSLSGSSSTKCAGLLGLLLLLMLIPATALAGSTCLTGVVCVYNTGGTATGGASGLNMTGSNASTVYQIGGIGGSSSNLGTLEITTGAVTSGTLGSTVKGIPGAVTFGDGTFTITTNSTYTNYTGVLFTGTFSNITWIYDGKSNGFYDYTLSGTVTGTWEGGAVASGTTVQLYFHSGSPYTGGTISLGSGTSDIIVPEPASVGLMGTGLVGMGLLVRRRVRRQDNA